MKTHESLSENNKTIEECLVIASKMKERGMVSESIDVMTLAKELLEQQSYDILLKG